MNFNYKLISSVEKFIENSKLKEISIGCSNSQVFKIIKDNNTFFLKIAKSGLLTSEYEKLIWLQGKLNVPKIVLYKKTSNTEYLITESIEGKMVCDDYYINNPDIGIEVIAQAFSQIASVPVNDCPCDVSIDYKIKLVKNNVIKNNLTEKDLKPETLERFHTVSNLIEYLANNKFYDEKHFSHGDTSLPNIFAVDNKFSGFIDVGECGISDKWFDMAICEKSIRRNYGEKYIERFYKKINVIPDRKKINYYLLMMEL